jgi:uncharacterized protein (TIGR02001 family)
MACGGASGAIGFEGQVSGNLKASSDYLFRGIDRTDGPAIQGEVDYLARNGFYAGAWASNARAVGGSEFDAYSGYGRTITVQDVYPLHLDGGLIGYLFPGDESASDGRHNLDFLEAYAGARLGPATLKMYLSPDYANAGGVAAAFRGTLRWPVLEQLKLRLEGGINLGPGLKNYTARLSKDGRGHDYFDYAAMLEYALPEDFDIAAGVAGTTLDIADGRGRSGEQPKLLLEVGKRFDF